MCAALQLPAKVVAGFVDAEVNRLLGLDTQREVAFFQRPLPQRAVICGVHSDSNQAADSRRKDKKVMRIVEFPFDVDPVSTRATLQSGKLQVVLPRSR